MTTVRSKIGETWIKCVHTANAITKPIEKCFLDLMLGMLGGGENMCGWVFMMELLPLGYPCMRT